jgi:hypothetical protein
MMKKRALVGLFVLLLTAPALAQSGGSQYQFPTTPWQAFAPATEQCGSLLGANMNSTADQVIPISFPSANYRIDSILVTNPSVSLTTAVGGIYPAASKAGVAIVANSQAYSGLTSATANTAGNLLALTLASSTTAFNLKGLYFSLTTPQGAAATADIRVRCAPLY